MRKFSTALTSVLISSAALAHEGHGATSTHHWHATDIWGFVVFGALAIIVIWHLRK